MAGKLYGLGIGPGDPELITLKAKKLLDQAALIACPVKEVGEASTALNIVKQVVDLSSKEILEVVFRMDKDIKKREQCRKEAAKVLTDLLDQDKDIVMITLGDVAIYSTYIYVHQMIKAMGYETEIVPGISSFSSGAAMAEISLIEGNESLAVVSGLMKLEKLEEMITKADNLVIMKAGSRLPEIKQLLEKYQLADQTMVISNVGMEDEYIGKVDLSRTYGYFTTLIIKKGGL